MPTQRGLVPPALAASTIVLVLCAVAWGALGAFSIAPATHVMPVTLHRYLCIMLATLTICAGMVNLTARILRAIRATADDGGGYAAGYAEGYREGVSAQPVPVATLSRARR